MGLEAYYDPIYEFLSKVEGSQTEADTNIIGDYSDAGLGETIFFIKPPKGKFYEIWRTVLAIRDNTPINAGGYGAGSALTNGIFLRTWNDQGLKYLYTNLPVKTTAGWAGGYCYDVKALDFGGGENFAVGRWTFEKSGIPIYLNGNLGDKLELIVHDPFDHLTGHYFHVQGRSKSIHDI